MLSPAETNAVLDQRNRYRAALQRIADHNPDDGTGLIDCIDIAIDALK